MRFPGLEIKRTGDDSTPHVYPSANGGWDAFWDGEEVRGARTQGDAVRTVSQKVAAKRGTQGSDDRVVKAPGKNTDDDYDRLTGAIIPAGIGMAILCLGLMLLKGGL